MEKIADEATRNNLPGAEAMVRYIEALRKLLAVVRAAKDLCNNLPSCDNPYIYRAREALQALEESEGDG